MPAHIGLMNLFSPLSLRAIGHHSSRLALLLAACALMLIAEFFLVVRPWWRWTQLLKNAPSQHVTAAQVELQVLPWTNADGADFKFLQNSGHLGQEDRLAWVDMLDRLAQHESVGLRYEILPQQEISRTGAAVLRRSVVRLYIQALHEGHWLGLVSMLTRPGPYTFVADSCVMGLQPTVASDAATRALPLAGECDFSWYSIVPVNEDKRSGPLLEKSDPMTGGGA